MKVDNIFYKIAEKLEVDIDSEELTKITQYECVKALLDSYRHNCGVMQDYDLQYSKVFVRACERPESDPQTLASRVKKVCSTF
jgi:hypothetical protein